MEEQYKTIEDLEDAINEHLYSCVIDYDVAEDEDGKLLIIISVFGDTKGINTPFEGKFIF